MFDDFSVGVDIGHYTSPQTGQDYTVPGVDTGLPAPYYPHEISPGVQAMLDNARFGPGFTLPIGLSETLASHRPTPGTFDGHHLTRALLLGGLALVAVVAVAKIASR